MLKPKNMKDAKLAIKSALEMQSMADGDWGGEQRAFHLPRLNKIVQFLITEFPNLTMDVMEKGLDTPFNDEE